MNYKIIIQPTAFQEIEDSYRWMCNNLSTKIAEQWYYQLQDAILSLQKFLNSYPLAPETSTTGRGIRQLWVGKRYKYRVLFVVEEGVIAILHVRYRQRPLLGNGSE